MLAGPFLHSLIGGGSAAACSPSVRQHRCFRSLRRRVCLSGWLMSGFIHSLMHSRRDGVRKGLTSKQVVFPRSFFPFVDSLPSLQDLFGHAGCLSTYLELAGGEFWRICRSVPFPFVSSNLD
mmetsp:Transcript_7768/g.15117  ORF Transcript_7768/g.15117 Transcript_7768/m.15117 type:complete len:122 (+) Transcript_7768:1026-1391(+)